ncbi:MAG: DUF4864 domain-containing protein [Sulfitobacter sp.]
MRTGLIGLLTGALLLIASSFGAVAQQADIQGTIDSQFEAFKSDDFETAFTFATPNLQRMFQNPQNFERMVTGGYPMVWRPAGVRYLNLRQENGAMVQTVEITDAKGLKHLLDYRMEQTAEGWRIGGVQILDAPGIAA